MAPTPGRCMLVSLGTGAQDAPCLPSAPLRSISARGAQLTLIELSIGDGAYLHNPVLVRERR